MAKILTILPIFQKSITLPVDLIIMRIIEVINAVPALLLIIAFAAIFNTNTLWPIIFNYRIFLIGQVLPDFFRGELLRVRNMEFIQASRAFGIQ